MGVRIDLPGVRWWDYHTVGAGMEMRIAEGEGKTKPGAMLTRREYLCDASFLVALQGEPGLHCRTARQHVKAPNGRFTSAESAARLPARCWSIRPAIFPICFRRSKSVPWRPRLKGDRRRKPSIACSTGSRHLNSPKRPTMRSSGMTCR